MSNPSDQIGNNPKPTARPWTPPTTTYQNLPNLTTPDPSDQIGNSPKPAANLPDPARRGDLPRLTKTYQT